VSYRAYGRFPRYTVYQAYSNVRFFSIFPLFPFSVLLTRTYMYFCIFVCSGTKNLEPDLLRISLSVCFRSMCRQIFNYRRHHLLYISLRDPNRAVIVILSSDKRPRYLVPYSWFIPLLNILLSITPNFKTSHHGLLSIDPLWQR
jgi:hypothetical protein